MYLDSKWNAQGDVMQVFFLWFSLLFNRQVQMNYTPLKRKGKTPIIRKFS